MPEDLSELRSILQRVMLCHSPSGAEKEIDELLENELRALGHEVFFDEADNLYLVIKGLDKSRLLAVAAHKDELGMLVGRIGENGVLFPERLNGAYPWVYGEGPVEIIGDNSVVRGILSFGSRHVATPSTLAALHTERALQWNDTWVETKCSAHDLLESGVRVGSRIVVARSRKGLIDLPHGYCAGYAADNRVGIAALLLVLKSIQQPRFDTIFAFPSKEEIGAVGSMYLWSRLKPTDVVALEICPESDQCHIYNPAIPHLLSRDGHSIYSEPLIVEIRSRLSQCGMDIPVTTIARFGSDASIPMKYGHVPRAACLAVPTQNSHGFEIFSLRAVHALAQALIAFI